MTTAVASAACARLLKLIDSPSFLNLDEAYQDRPGSVLAR
ncbi:hypothetical protein D777_01276 [Marinobacter nitratireducens]|uniref:Uncharacterized protein n=1 Tax=Marinobacter nitratireducens TaxID=1137280 RepID=A0A072N5Y2_9GAMM|nr:hypothetical protein D777_01276 [Marinobacter nitratireducens]